MSRLYFLSLLLVAALLPWASPAAAKVELSLELDREAVVRGGEAGLEVLAVVERGWHINAHRPNESYLIPTEASIEAPAGITIDKPTYPPPDSHQFAFAAGKTLLVYEGKVGITTGIKLPAEYKEKFVRLTARLHYQACNDSTCLPPATALAELVVRVEDKTAGAPAAGGDTSASPFDSAGRPTVAGFDVGDWLATRGLAATLALVFVLGLGLNLTPCVYPLISVTIAYFGSQSHHRPARTIGLACVYVFGVTMTFTAVGAAAAYSGGIFGAALQKPIVTLFIAGVLVALALSSFGLYELRPPVWLMQRVGAAAPGVVGSLFMGATMGIVAAPCVGPVVLGLIVFVGSQQNLALGLGLFFTLGLGLGVPYIGLAMAAGSIKKLPRSGEWMLWVERLFGFLLIGLALHFVRPLLPLTLQHWALPALIGFAGLYLGFVDPAGRAMPRFRIMQWSTGAAALVVAGWFAIPHAAHSRIQWQVFHPAAAAAALRNGRPALIDFVADWCIPCHEMDNSTYLDAEVQGEAQRFAMFRADITRESEENSALVEEYNVDGVPTVIYLDGGGREVTRQVGFVSADEMVAAMRQVP